MKIETKMSDKIKKIYVYLIDVIRPIIMTGTGLDLIYERIKAGGFDGKCIMVQKKINETLINPRQISHILVYYHK